MPGKDVCETLREHCGGGREGALCLKVALEEILPNDRQMEAIRSSMHVAPEFYFLCAGPSILGSPVGSAREAQLTDMLRQAVSQGSLETRPAANHSGTEYRHAARWSKLADWAVEEKVEHFMHALEILPDNSHCIDRLAVALGEAGSTSLENGPGPPASVMRGMLLHYAVLRGIVVHPLQRPLVLTPGLTARPFWEVYPTASNGGSAAPWLSFLVITYHP